MQRFKEVRGFFWVVMLAYAMGIFIACANMGATNTTATNVGVTSYETAGSILTSSYNTEKAMLKAGTITAAQDQAFQMGPYKKAVDCYKAIGTAAVMVLSLTGINLTSAEISKKQAAQKTFDTLNAQLPGLIAEVTKFISGGK